MSTRNSEFFLDVTPPPDEEGDLMQHLKPQHRVALLAAFLAAMIGYLGWLIDG